MKALVLVAHGSRRQASNDEVRALSKKIAKEMGNDFPIIVTGFLELAKPLIPDAIDASIKQGATDVCVVPYFLSAGRHVQEDVPAEVEKARKMHSEIPMVTLPHIGGAPMMIDLIRDTVMNRTDKTALV